MQAEAYAALNGVSMSYLNMYILLAYFNIDLYIFAKNKLTKLINPVPGRVIFFLRLFRAVPGSGRFQLTNLLGHS